MGINNDSRVKELLRSRLFEIAGKSAAPSGAPPASLDDVMRAISRISAPAAPPAAAAVPAVAKAANAAIPPGMFNDILKSSLTTASNRFASEAMDKAILPKLFKPSLAERILGSGGLARKALALGAIGAAIGAGAHGYDRFVAPKLDDAIGAQSAEAGFKRMLRENPSLASDKDELPTMRKFYKTLSTFSPRMANDPLVAGSFIRRSMQFKDEGIQPNDVKLLADIQGASEKSGPRPLAMKAFFDLATTGLKD